MQLTYETDGNQVVVDPALLVIACDPRELEPVMDYTSEERKLLRSLQNFTFYTTCLRVKPRDKHKQERVVILDPDRVEPQKGLVQGYRNETAKRWGLGLANKAKTNIVTVYQMVGADELPNVEKLERERHTFLHDPPSWWPFQPGWHEIVQVDEDQDGSVHPAENPLLTPYFNHFSFSALEDGAPWRWLDIQGMNDTMYVHASTCFESVLHCWSYIKMLVDEKPLPEAKNSAIVIVGAGVSGLLFAQRMIKSGYTNVTLLERGHRFGGKTHSLRVPESDSNRTTIAELGTCYLSPAYDDMAHALSEFTVGNARVPAAHGSERGIVVKIGDEKKVVPFDEYGRMVACKYLGYGWPCSELDQGLALLEVLAGAANYVRLRLEIFDTLDGVMPKKRPHHDPHGVFSKTFLQFLEDNHMGALRGYLVYAYEVQGYGDLDKIPAYYGLVWITPDIAYPFGKTSGVTAWQKGWEDVWDQMVEKCDMIIKLNAEVVSIVR